ALNNGDFTRWQHAAAGRAPHCAIGHVLTRGVTPCPPASVADTSIYCATPHAPPRPQDAADVTLPPFAPLVAAAGPPGHRRGARRRRVAVLRRVLAPARGGQPAQRRAPGADVRVRARRPPDGAVRRDAALPGPDRGRARGGEAGLHRDRGQPVL